jgi:type II secretory pathway component PulC
VAASASAATAPATPVITAEMVAELMQFKGVVSNPGTRNKVAIISVRGKDYFVHANEKIEEVRILRIEKTGIKISYKGMYFELHSRGVTLALGK